MNIVETKNLTKHFDGVAAVDRLSFSVLKGSITSIIGPNGAGKTTLINVLSGLLPFDSGDLIIHGVHIHALKPHEMHAYRISRTFQNIRLFEQMTVHDNLLVVLTRRNVFEAIFERHNEYHLKKAEEILKLVGLWEKKYALAANLSYGQRKLLEIARAIGTDPEAIFFDEPFAGLFSEMVATGISLIKELKKRGCTVILIEHNMEIVRALSDHVIVMDSGRLLAEGKPEDVLKRKEVVEAYLGE